MSQSHSNACFMPQLCHERSCHHAGQLFGWELFSTFVLVSTVFAVAIGKPNFGVAGPLIVGVALWACALCSKLDCSNPARVQGAVIHKPCRLPGSKCQLLAGAVVAVGVLATLYRLHTVLLQEALPGIASLNGGVTWQCPPESARPRSWIMCYQRYQSSLHHARHGNSV